MTIGILASAVIHPQDLIGFSTPPAWRKATRNMVMAVRAMDMALAKVPMVLEGPRSQIGMVVGTNSGEIETSAEFVTTLARTKMARPLLFQNSLHNATTGFAAIHFGLTGAAFTISDGDRTPSEAANLAAMLIREEICTAVVVTLIEVHKLLADYIGEQIPEGACTLVLANAEQAQRWGYQLQPLGSEVITPYEVEPNHRPLYDITSSGFYRTALHLHERAK
jgi:hypothetical protein